MERDTGRVEMVDLEEQFWKSIEGIPGKAWHDVIHMVVYGRLHKDWAESMLAILKVSLLTRHMPQTIKELTHLLIPKSTPRVTQPLAICYDAFCFLSAIVAQYLQEGLEQAGMTIQETVAFVKGHRCDDITETEIGLREHTTESGQHLVSIEEDEEKFYDQASLELQLVAQQWLGCPPMGYVEFKADDMVDRKVYIVTWQGNTIAIYQIGLL